MNIVILEDSSKHKYGGGQAVTMMMLKILKTRYNNLYVIDCLKESLFNTAVDEFIPIKHKLQIFCFGKLVERAASSFNIGILESVFFPVVFLINSYRIISFLSKERLNQKNTIFYAASKKPLLYAFFIWKIKGIKYIYHAHSFDEKESFFYKIILPALNSTSLILCVSNFIKNNISTDNCITLYNPISFSPERKSARSMKDKKVIVATISSLTTIKGIDYFIDSFNLLDNNKRSVEYRIYGDGPLMREIANKRSQNILIMGFCREIETVLEEVDIFVLPSIIPEACPMVILEAMNAGIPVITTNIGGQAELVDSLGIGFTVDVKNSLAIAKKIDVLIRNPELYESFSVTMPLETK